jgi:hypothetical protein
LSSGFLFLRRRFEPTTLKKPGSTAEHSEAERMSARTPTTSLLRSPEGNAINCLVV